MSRNTAPDRTQPSTCEVACLDARDVARAAWERHTTTRTLRDFRAAESAERLADDLQAAAASAQATRLGAE